jgi:ABC-type branched-subunit amino acid transport system substrate-binding protein
VHRRVLALLLAACLPLLAVCSPLPTSERDVKVGVIVSRKGAPGSSSREVLAGLEMALGDSGAGRGVELAVRADGGEPERAARAARELAGDREVLAVVTATSYACRRAASRELGRAGVAMLSVAGIPAERDGVGSSGGRVFSLLPGARATGRSMAEYARRVLGASHVFVVSDRGPFGSAMHPLFRDEAAQAGLALAGSCVNEPGVVSLADCVLRGMNRAHEAVDAVVCFGSSAMAKKLARDLRRRGRSQPVLAASDGLSAEGEGPGVKSLYTASAFLWDMAPLRAQIFRERYQERTDEAPGQAAALGRDAGWLAGRAVASQGPDRERIRAFFAEVGGGPEPVMGVTGPLGFEPSGAASRRVLFALAGETGPRAALLQLTGNRAAGAEERSAFGLMQLVRVCVAPRRVLAVDPERGEFRAEVLVRLAWRGKSPVADLELTPGGERLSRIGERVAESANGGVRRRTLLLDRAFPVDWPLGLGLGAAVALPVTVAVSADAASRLAVVPGELEIGPPEAPVAGYEAAGSRGLAGYVALPLPGVAGEGPWLLQRYQLTHSALVRPLLRAHVLDFWLPATLPVLLGLAALAAPRDWRWPRLVQAHLALGLLLVVQVLASAVWPREVGYPYGWAPLLAADAGLALGALLCWLGLGLDRGVRRRGARLADAAGRWVLAPVLAAVWLGLSWYLW